MEVKKVRAKKVEVKPVFVEQLAEEVMKSVKKPLPVPSPSKLVESATELKPKRGRPINPNSKRQQRLRNADESGGNRMIMKDEKTPKRMM